MGIEFCYGRKHTTDAKRSDRPIKLATPEITEKIHEMVMVQSRSITFKREKPSVANIISIY